ncbi:MAG: DUF5112 domain-containing protein [Prevotella sp.]|nr:DUF5112 domain-containing protein [Prevotella sp.]
MKEDGGTSNVGRAFFNVKKAVRGKFHLSGVLHFFSLFLFVFLFSCTPKHKEIVDSYNRASYRQHYKSLDSTYTYAMKAFQLSSNYEDGRAEAINNLAFVNISRMNYAEAKRLLDSVYVCTDNQIELLIAYIQQMRLCQRESRNKDFYDYQEKASRSLKRINEEKRFLDEHQQQRMVYAESEFSIVTSTYYYYVGQMQSSADALNRIDPNGEIQRDTAQYLNYLYQIGAGGVINSGTKEEIAQQEWDYLMRCYLLSQRSNDIYWEANALQGMSEHMFEPESRDRLIADNLPAMKYVNEDNMPDTLLAGYLAQKSLELFADYGDVYQIAGSYRTLAQCYWAIGDYRSSILCLEDALHKNESIELAPDLVASIRERLSLTYSAIDDKKNSDINRNIYLDMQKKTRQDSELEARAEQLNRSSAQLNLMIWAVVVMIVIVALSIFFFDYLRRKKDRNKPLTDLLQPLREWQEKNEAYLESLMERQDEINEKLVLNQMNIERNKRRNVENRAKIFLVNSVTPFIDRIINEVKLLKNRKETENVREERLTYMAELTDKINDYNNVLTQWIQLQQGQLSLHIESFPVQDLFDIVQKSRMSFKLKGIDLQITPTEEVVKADRILTLFMINTIADNARKFTPDGGTVRISASEVEMPNKEQCVEISIQDTGAGIDEQQLSTIFEHKVSGGHGFGLMNCKGIIEKYRKVSQIFNVCSISAESKVGEGSRFFFRLPKGVVRSLLWLLMLLSLPSNLFADQMDDLHRRSSVYADSVYELNLSHDYLEAIEYADSALQTVNQMQTLLGSKKRPLALYEDSALTPAEIIWHKDSIPVDYNMLLFLRNELAVAALASHNWPLYTYNNNVYTKLYKELTADRTLGEYVKTMQRSELNKNIAIILLVLLLIAIVVAYYILYYRHRLYFSFCMERVEHINEMLLSNQTDEEKLSTLATQMEDADRFPPELKSIVEKIRSALEISAENKKNQRLSIELAQDECRRSEYEDQKLYVSNNVLDNCLSTLKHETMYYPSRIRQLVDEVTGSSTTSQQEVVAIDELVMYYKELYSLLSAQAMRQVDSIKHECRPMTIHGGHIVGEEAMIKYLFEILQKQSGEKTLQVKATNKDEHYVMFDVLMPKLRHREFFVPSTQNIPFLICRQIVRENSEYTNHRGCGIVSAPIETGGTCFTITLARSNA